MAKTSLEYIASNADEAVEKGLTELGLKRDQVDVEILDNGSRGIFGLGGRQARVRLTVKEEPVQPAPVAEKAAEPEPVPAPVPTPEPVKTTEEKPSDTADSESETGSESEEEDADIVNEKTLEISIGVVKDLLEKMRIHADVEGRIGLPEDDADSKIIMIDIKGNDLSYLIGRHSETLNALQYVTSLIVGRELGHWVPLIIDVQGYRERREKQLRQMASRMAEQVAKSGRRIALEPMPATERRIIHLTLRDNPNVTTESIGEEPSRKVVILPKNGK